MSQNSKNQTKPTLLIAFGGNALVHKDQQGAKSFKIQHSLFNIGHWILQ